MKLQRFITGVRLLTGLASLLSVALAQSPRAFVVQPVPIAKVVVDPKEGWEPDQTPADFLDGIGGRVKARWRQLYREAPPPPTAARPLSAFVLGGLMADSFIALQATDAQQFRNNNQDILTYCRVLGLNEKLAPRLMSQGKLAEKDKWTDLRQEVVDGHQVLCRVLHEQRDEDLAVLVDLGIWLRLLEVVSHVVEESQDKAMLPLAIGSPKLLLDLQNRFGRISEAVRMGENVASIGDALDFLCRHWDNDLEPDLERVQMSHRKIALLIRKILNK